MTATQTAELAPRLANGIELIGEYAGSGYKEPPSLARRADGQMIQLTELLYLVAAASDGSRDLDAIAEEVTANYGRGVSADNVRTLVEDKLRPLGVLAAADGSSLAIEKPDPLLALRFRRAVIPEHMARPIALLFKPLFWPPVVLAALAGLVAFDSWLFLHHGVAQGFREALYHPSLLLLVLGLVVISAAWHEFGHAAGCAYGGACPGAMGAGIYLAYPAFYTDVTDSYRLSKGGRLRTDLAGVYFNGLFILAVAGLYAVTGFEPLLLVIVVQHIEAVHQLLPVLRLDGYYIVADLTGVPDLFSRIKPILTSTLPFKRTGPEVRQLKFWVRIVVTAWVLVIVPLLLFQLGMILLHLPRIVGTAWDSLGRQRVSVGKAWGSGDVLGLGLGVVQTLVLVLPLVGLAVSFGRMGGRLWRWGMRVTAGRILARGAFVLLAAAALGGLVFVWLPDGDYQPIDRRERGTLSDGIAAVRAIDTGHPALAVRDRAVARDEVADATTTTTTIADEESTTTTTDASGVGTGGASDWDTTTTTDRATTTTTETTSP